MLALEFKGWFIQYVRKIFQKTNIFDTLTRTRTCAYQGVRFVSFLKILRTYKINDPWYDKLL